MGKTTTERGLGYEHQKLRRLLLPTAWGKACPICGYPMVKGQSLDLDHSVPRALGGGQGPCRITHSGCNRSAGARLGNLLRRGRPHRARKPRW